MPLKLKYLQNKNSEVGQFDLSGSFSVDLLLMRFFFQN